jgi:hypothetical protein
MFLIGTLNEIACVIVAMLLVGPAVVGSAADMASELSGELQECSMFYIAIATMMRTEAERPDPYAPPAEINATDQYMKAADQFKN